jgi:hypothetical protein
MRTIRKLDYRTLDEVNGDLAARLGEEFAFGVAVSFPDGPVPGEGGAAALVIDLDHQGLDPAGRARLVGGLSTRPLPGPVALHSYSLQAEEVEALRGNGVLVSRRLDSELFRRLAEVIDGTGRGAAA